MRKFILSILIIVLLSAQTTRGDPVYTFNSEILVNEYNHVTFTVLRDIELHIEGISSDIIDFMALNEKNYQNWLDQLNYTALYRENLVGEFFIELIPLVPINSTLNLLFYNAGNKTVNIDLTINEIFPKTEDSPFPFPSLIAASSIILILYRKSIRSS